VLHIFTNKKNKLVRPQPSLTLPPARSVPGVQGRQLRLALLPPLQPAAHGPYDQGGVWRAGLPDGRGHQHYPGIITHSSISTGCASQRSGSCCRNELNKMKIILQARVTCRLHRKSPKGKNSCRTARVTVRLSRPVQVLKVSVHGGDLSPNSIVSPQKKGCARTNFYAFYHSP
jgi:hypothetical protein